jgi:DNA-binding transcriptional LysR family regulator
METRQLEAFLAIVDIGSFTRAAARLHLSQPTVTARIKALEQELGSTLLDRRSSGITPTTAGAEFLPYAREVVALTARARDALGSGGEPHGRLDIGTIESLTNYRLLPVIEYLYLRYPRVEISMHSPPAGDALSQVRGGQLQCAFFIDTMQDRDDLDVKVLCPEPLALVCGRHHPLAERPTVTDADVRDLTLVRSDNTADYHVRFEHALHLADAEQRPRLFELGSIEAAKRSVANGMGIALMPTVAVERELAKGHLRRLNWFPRFTTFTQVACRRESGPNTALIALVAIAVQVIEEQSAATRARPVELDGRRHLRLDTVAGQDRGCGTPQAQPYLRHRRQQPEDAFFRGAGQSRLPTAQTRRRPRQGDHHGDTEHGLGDPPHATAAL